MSRSNLVAVVAILVSLSAAGCAASGEPSSTNPATSTSVVPSSVVPSSAAPSSSAATDGCPVTAEALHKALVESPNDMYARAAEPGSLKDAFCLGGYAAAKTVPSGMVDSSWVLFKFDPAVKVWVPVNVGTSNYCTGFVPDSIAAKFPGCA